MATSGGVITIRPREFYLYGEFWHEVAHITLGLSAWFANFGFFLIWPDDTAYTVGCSTKCHAQSTCLRLMRTR